MSKATGCTTSAPSVSSVASTRRVTSSGNWTCPPWASFHEACNSDVLPVGDLLMVSTSNGQNEGHTRVPSPRAPSLIAVDKRSGKVVWRAIGAGEKYARPVVQPCGGQCPWAHPGTLRRRRWLLRSYDALSGHETGDLTAIRKTPVCCRDQEFSRGAIMASPVYDDGRVFVAMGQSPGHGNGPSLIHAISPNGQGDVTESRPSGLLARSVVWWEPLLRKTVSSMLGTWAGQFIVWTRRPARTSGTRRRLPLTAA